LLAALAVFGLALAAEERTLGPWKRGLVAAAGAVPGIILLTPLIYQLSQAVPISLSEVVVTSVVLLCALLVPVLKLLPASRAWVLPCAALLVAVGLTTAASATSQVDAKRPEPSSLFYGSNATSGGAVLASSAAEPDAWTTQVLTEYADRGELPAFFPGSTRRYLHSLAPSVELPAPDAVRLDDAQKDGVRTLRVRAVSQRRAPVISIYVDAGVEVLGASVNGKRVARDGKAAPAAGAAPWGISFYAPPEEGVELTLELRDPKPVKITIIDQSYELPRIPGRPLERPDSVMPSPKLLSDSTLVSKTFTF
jgi:hypothetical protein